MPGDHAIARHPLVAHAEIVAIVFHEQVIFFKTVFIEKNGETLTGGKLSLGVLRIDTVLAAAKTRLFPLLFQRPNDFLHSFPPKMLFSAI